MKKTYKNVNFNCYFLKKSVIYILVMNLNLVVYYGRDKDILKIVYKYKNEYAADVYQIKTLKDVTLMNKLTNSNINIQRCNLNLKNYERIILISPLWFNKVPLPVIRFLEQGIGRINKIVYILYNKNKADKPMEFNKMDRILNLHREKSYFVKLTKDSINIRVYQ